MDDDTVVEQDTPAPPSRRTMLRTLGAAAGGGLVGLFALAKSADAATGTMQYGAANDAGTSVTSLSTNAASGTALSVTNLADSAQAYAIKGASVGASTGVYGLITSSGQFSTGVWGDIDGTQGIAVVASGGRAQLLIDGGGVDPSVGALTHLVGEVVMDLNKVLWYCVDGGTPGTWRRLASPATAGALHAISPSRVYDSRLPSINPLAAGATRTVSVADRINTSTGAVAQAGIIPAGATAIAYNLTIADTAGAGFLAVNEGGNSVAAASAINWTAAGTTLANASLVKLNATRQVTVICGGTPGAHTNFVIDVVGYYR